MATEQVVRTITIRGRSEGVEALKTQLEGLATAQDGVSVSGEKVTRSFLSAEQAYQRQTMRLDEGARMQDKYNRELAILDKAKAQGIITDGDYAARLDLINKKVGVANGTHAGLSTQAMAASHSIRGFTEMIIQGVPPTQALAMETNNLSYAMSHPGGLTGAMKEGISVFTKFLTPMTLMIGIPAAIAGGLYLMNRMWKESALALDNTARAAGLTIGQLRALSEAAEIKGIADFAKDAEKFSGSIYSAANGMGSLAQLLRVNGERATDFEGTLESVSRIIQRARDDQQRLQLLQQAGLPATMEWVRLLQQGPEALRKAYEEGANLSKSEQEMIDRARQFDERWNENWAHFKSGAHEAFLTAKGGLETLLEKAEKWQSAAGGFISRLFGGVATTDLPDVLKNRNTAMGFGPTGAGGVPLTRLGQDGVARTGGAAVDPQVAAHSLQMEAQRLSLLGNLATVQDKVRQSQIQINEARLNGVAISQKDAAAILEMTRTQALGAQLQQRVQEGLASSEELRAQKLRELNILVANGTINVNEAAAAQRSYERVIRDTVDQMEVYKAALPQLKQLELESGRLDKQFDQIATGSLNQMTTSLADMMDGTKSAGQAFSDLSRYVVRALEEMMIKMLIVQPIASALQATLGAGGGGFNFLSLLGIGGGGGGGVGIGHAHSGIGPGEALSSPVMVHPAYFEMAPRFHSGRLPWDPSFETPAIIRDDESVLTPGQMRAMGGGKRPINITVNSYGAEVSDVQQDDDGNMEMTVRAISRDEMASARTNAIQKQKYGQSPQLRQRRG